MKSRARVRLCSMAMLLILGALAAQKVQAASSGAASGYPLVSGSCQPGAMQDLGREEISATLRSRPSSPDQADLPTQSLQLYSFVDVRSFTLTFAAPVLTPEATLTAAPGRGTLPRELTGSHAEYSISQKGARPRLGFQAWGAAPISKALQLTRVEGI
jgi:hypothetical protein